MHLRNAFEVQQRTHDASVAVRPHPVHAAFSPSRSAVAQSPYHQTRSPMPPSPHHVHFHQSPLPPSPHHYVGHLPHSPYHHQPSAPTHPVSPYHVGAGPYIQHPSPQRLSVQSPFHGVSPQRLIISPQRLIASYPSPAHPRPSDRKRARSPTPSSSASELDYSSSDSESNQYRSSKAQRTEYFNDENSNRVVLSKPPSPPKYFASVRDEDLSEDINSSDSEFEGGGSDVDSVSLDDLRDFIDFRPKYNKTKISRKSRSVSAGGDALEEFLFDQPAKPRKWFKALAWNAVGAKLTRKPSRTDPEPNSSALPRSYQ